MSLARAHKRMSLPVRHEAVGKSVQRRCAVLIGESERPLIELLSDVLAEIDVTVHVDLPRDGSTEHDVHGRPPPDLVLVVVDRNDFAGPFGRARAIAAGAPVVAILPFQDERLMRRAIAFGASTCYSLDSPIEQLRSGIFVRSDPL